jgi:hypothetical protein
LRRLLTEGLLKGYAGKSKFNTVERGPFHGEESLLETPNGVYLDQWFAHQRGGGQELVILETGEAMSRVYWGGTVDKEVLDELGITDEDVSAHLTGFITEAGNKTRLTQDYFPTPREDWNYRYRVLAGIKELQATLGLEELSFRDNLAFAHYIGISPVK